MPDARFARDREDVRLVTSATVGAGEVWQLPDGRAAVYTGAGVSVTGARVAFNTDGQYTMTKATGFQALAGNRAYWDASANNVSYRKVGDRDFYLGRFAEDSVSGDTVCVVNLNVDPPYDCDLVRDAFLTSPTGTQALGGFLPPRRDGGALRLLLSATSEVQKVDALGVETFSKLSNAVVEVAFRVITGGAAGAPDFNIGIAGATHATDADAIVPHLLLHVDGNSTNLNLQSKDGTTTVAATDTTADYTAGSALANRVEVWFDLRDEADVQCYVNGSLVLPSTVFSLAAAATELALLAHLEKTAATDQFEVAVDWARVRLCEQQVSS